MAEQMDKATISAVKEMYPDYAVVAYINTTAALKTVCDVCVTSSQAVEIVSKMPEKNILFIPDCNLGDYVRKQLPDALFLVHPECQPEVVKHADYVGSTSGIMSFAEKSQAKEFIIGTEISIAELLQYECPDKNFYPLSKDLICSNMKATTLMDVYNTVKGTGGEEITLDEETILKARKCIDKMIELGE